MDKYDVEDSLRSLFEHIVDAAEEGTGIAVHLTNGQCKAIRDAIENEAVIIINLEGLFDNE